VRHPVVGSWRISVAIPGAPSGPINLARFSADGGVIVAFPSPTPAVAGASHRLEYWTPAIGSWAPTSDREASAAFIALGSDENGAPIGTHSITATLGSDAGGDDLYGPFTITVAGADGKALGSVSGTITGSRITADVNAAS
jgi:hypothetical protein